MDFSMTKHDDDNNATWTKIVVSKTDYRNIMWTDLLKIAEDNWKWVQTQPFPNTAQGSCLVAALFLPSISGGVIFLSTIPRGSKHTEMMNGDRAAPAWFGATTGGTGHNTGLKLHAEDGAEFLFETSRHARGIVRNSQYITPDRNNEHSRMQLAVWGRHRNSPLQGESIALCTVGEKQPKCPAVARTLNIAYCEQYKVRFEEENR
ncbi:hypothetical protein QBC40DRAFT_219198 [Triangularia verruculosa]|uniref:Uncharacterized protein n=1 Tax=Triangularia verruculosa TaxID=2587418 RepID=A0AAN6XQN6_9PEZI|nr:hypothetical protein QBC40DRAFT_219198 [Triangularia verruculosa]